ncbi:uncharacterized protein CIMG_03521 [Coccidioides immitis RS]|uniref:Secreted protein n=4 Tax=Coccidioides immitis TaxID=5501 RepID=J3KBJ3_COCIM|nr:uncharacterized protein CIMG_03521 [Coccidioides immitis RS]EAS32497.3 hypothetical protein CIMG_03521 [Coccidioides immitis RS]KMP07733.1 hypothetical protein CIRG_07414 [Coccidioides immitis RMSCC 2394]KMU71812.1 hypothetical protein CISG_00122 [Coccidioides immitis RMSCC 3703]KMU82822.1 hypothetical protein CIHG_00605 [Coccidioides immitis H538.4]
MSRLVVVVSCILSKWISLIALRRSMAMIPSPFASCEAKLRTLVPDGTERKAHWSHIPFLEQQVKKPWMNRGKSLSQILFLDIWSFRLKLGISCACVQLMIANILNASLKLVER